MKERFARVGVIKSDFTMLLDKVASFLEEGRACKVASSFGPPSVVVTDAIGDLFVGTKAKIRLDGCMRRSVLLLAHDGLGANDWVLGSTGGACLLVLVDEILEDGHCLFAFVGVTVCCWFEIMRRDGWGAKNPWPSRRPKPSCLRRICMIAREGSLEQYPDA